jgi:hypothetical protein
MIYSKKCIFPDPLEKGIMPAVKGDNMRGLLVFISDIRNCKYLLMHRHMVFTERKLAVAKAN